jgi:ribosome-associated protein
MIDNKKDELKNVDSDVLAKETVKILLEKKALDVKLFCVKDNASITDYYVNATGRSSTQVSSLADDVDRLLSERGRNALRIEGRSGGAWILVDYGDVIVNVFDRPSREFYNFDRHLPLEGEIDISDLVAEVDKKFELIKAKE